MKRITYDSPVINILNNLTDIMLVNLLFLICCLPVFTIAASRCALYSVSKKWIQGKDAGCKIFWEVFCSNIKAGIGISVLQALFTAFLILDISLVIGNKQEAIFLKIVLALALVLFSAASIQMNLIFYKFNCTYTQYIKNSVFLFLAHPLRTLVLIIVFCVPIVIAFAYPKLLFAIIPILLLLYFSLEGILAIRLMGGIFDRLEKKGEINAGHKSY